MIAGCSRLKSFNKEFAAIEILKTGRNESTFEAFAVKKSSEINTCFMINFFILQIKQSGGYLIAHLPLSKTSW